MWARDPIKNQPLVSGILQKNTWPRWVVDFSPRYGHVILVSRYLVLLTGVNWSWHGCPISKKYTVNKAACMSLSTYYVEYGRHVARLHRRAYTPTSNIAAHDNHVKINSWVSFSLYGYGAQLGGPSGRRSSAMSNCHLSNQDIRWSVSRDHIAGSSL